MTIHLASLWLETYLQACSRPFEREPTMLDFIMLAMGLVFFALSIGYAVVCDQL
jgi:SNF family Na+-dependent transporter